MNKIIDESYTTLEDVLGYYYDCSHDFTDVAYQSCSSNFGKDSYLF